MKEKTTQYLLQFLDRIPSDAESLVLAKILDTKSLSQIASQLRDEGHRNLISYSRKIFIPLTKLCRDFCYYCTFAEAPKKHGRSFMTPEEVMELVKQGEAAGCKEALFTLGDKPELRYREAREELASLGHKTTLSYLNEIAKSIVSETRLLPHINAGVMTAEDLRKLRKVSVSQGLMLESSSKRLCEKGGPHYGSPDKIPEKRLETIMLAGIEKIPFTSGILIGIGETRLERIEALLALRKLHEKYGHLQEIIIQNFRAKTDTKMFNAPEPSLEDMIWTISVARIIFGPKMNLQAPPNLSASNLEALVKAGINDWGGVSPLTPDHVNPEAPWPELQELTKTTAECTGRYDVKKLLTERLAIYPDYAVNGEKWLDENIRTQVLRQIDSEGLARIDSWSPGMGIILPETTKVRSIISKPGISKEIENLLTRSKTSPVWSENDIERLLCARGEGFEAVCIAANDLRKKVNGDVVTYAVNRNINYTNICTFRCGFCSFSKGNMTDNLRGKPYNLNMVEIVRRAKEAWERGATEVCLQGGIHPNYTGQTYLDICKEIKTAVPGIHIHAFSPLEVWQGAKTLRLTVSEFLHRLHDAGLDTLPGTAAEVLDDEIRKIICPDKLNTEQWLSVMRDAHDQGFRTTATLMYGHVERPLHIARHFLKLLELQRQTGGFTEFVPLPFVHMETPIFLKGKARKGPTFREAILVHAVARLVLHPYFTNIQTSWVKMGPEGVKACLNAGANDLGGTLMNESITRAAGAVHGQEMSPEKMENIIRNIERIPRQRTTLYTTPVEKKLKNYNTSFDVGNDSLAQSI
ncbi:MAG: 5-amino-6-(D-ribitylamino)uracil--L-tyrosine 4-hydroxyphenyl transferase CofH [Deltaproteobacteria bacterium]|nr:5-amino-6-(D-ribitylamino)uracil--L-tyrosine 4-hydroxyphenyl transferase CofH [Deltaproteobacteria bacterium]